jgi:hypothetical protein
MRVGGLCMLLLFAICASMTISAVAQEREMGGVGITVFADTNFRGKSATFQHDVPNLAHHGFDNMISSLRIGPGEKWEVCDQANYRGRCVVVSGEERNLSNNSWSNIISSFRRAGGAPPPPPPDPGYIVLFDRPNYQGNPTNYNGPTPNLHRRAGSVTIGRGVWELCDGWNFTGRCVTLTTSVSNLATYSLSDRVLSVRPAASVPVTPPMTDWYVVLFERPNYQGNPRNYKTAAANIVGRSGSITIGRGVWEVCGGRNFTGRCVTLNTSVPSFATHNLRNGVHSLRPIGPQPR